MYLIQWEAQCQREQLQLTAAVHLKARRWLWWRWGWVVGGQCFGYKTELIEHLWALNTLVSQIILCIRMPSESVCLEESVL